MGIARLLHPRGHDLVDRLLRSLRLRIPEIFRRGIGILMLLNISIHPARNVSSPRYDSSIRRPLPLCRRRFRQTIPESAPEYSPPDGSGACWPASPRSAFRPCPLTSSSSKFHSGFHVLDRLARHPCGKAFIEPDVVPPLHRDQIAEPLMRHLVRNHAGDVFFRSTEPCFSSISRITSRNVMQPVFSIAPAEKSGRPIRSSFP